MLLDLDGDRLGADLERWEGEGGALSAAIIRWTYFTGYCFLGFRYVGPPGAKIPVREIEPGEEPYRPIENFRGRVL